MIDFVRTRFSKSVGPSMATVAMVWELGGGVGHMMPMQAIGAALAQHGHQVHAAVRDLTDAASVFGGGGVRCWQAPFKQRLTADAVADIVSFAHILWNTGFSDPDGLAALAGAWRHFFELLKPDLTLFDHSPTALLASRGLPMKRVLLGTGFAHPPAAAPLPTLRPWAAADPTRLAADEARVLEHANCVLAGWREPPMASLADLYGQIEDSFLVTLPVLDPYAPRSDVRYIDALASPRGIAPQWPRRTDARPRVFAYLKPFPALPALLAALTDLSIDAIIYAPEVAPHMARRHGSDRLCFCTRPLDMQRALAECDFAILNGTNASVMQLLQAGKASLQVPLVLEQVYNARAVQRLGAGLAASPTDRQELRPKLEMLLRDDVYSDAARRFARSAEARTQPVANAIDRLRQMLE